MTHPGEADLALFAGGDGGWLDRWRVGKHVRECAACREQVASFQRTAMALRDEVGRIPPDLRWERLASEMIANIHLGLEAGECVAPARPAKRYVEWRAAAVMAGMSLVLAAAWFLQPFPHGVEPVLRASKVEIRTTAAGLEVNENGNALVLMHGRGAQQQRAIIVSGPGTLRARYADGDTGQITINNVYSQ